MEKKTLIYIILAIVIVEVIIVLIIFSLKKSKLYNCINNECVPGGNMTLSECQNICGPMKLSFTPFGKTTCNKKNYFPENELNPGFYKICWFRLGASGDFRKCNRNALISAIIDNYNCIVPSMSIDIQPDGTFTDNLVDENRYYSELTNEIVDTAAKKGKLIVISPALIAGELYKYYKMYKNGLEKLYHFIIQKYNQNFIKSVVYDVEFWDDNDDKNRGTTDCDDHSRGQVHTGHQHCLYERMGSYMSEIARAWVKIRPDWEIFINDYPDSVLTENGDFIKAIKETPNLGFQVQDYWHYPNDNKTVNNYISLVGNAKKLVWGYAGYKQQNELWSKADFEKCSEQAKAKKMYGIFVFGGICFLTNNGLVDCPGFTCPN